MKDSVVLIVMILLLSACSQDKDEYTSRLTNNTEPKHTVNPSRLSNEDAMLFELGDYTTRLMQAVEDLCGHKIVFKQEKNGIKFTPRASDPLRDNMERHIQYELEVEYAGSTFEERIPMIIFTDDPRTISEDVICHEVWHLLLSAQSGIYHSGYGRPLYDHMIQKIPDRIALMEVFDYANAVLHHSYFFEKMTKAGYHLRESFERFGKIKDTYPPYDDIVRYFQVAIDTWHLKAGEVDNSIDNSEMLSIIRAQFPDSFDLGMRLYSISKEFTEPIREPEVFKKILAELFEYRNMINSPIGNRGKAHNLCIYH